MGSISTKRKLETSEVILRGFKGDKFLDTGVWVRQEDGTWIHLPRKTPLQRLAEAVTDDLQAPQLETQDLAVPVADVPRGKSATRH